MTRDLVRNNEFKVLKSVLDVGLIQVCYKILRILVSHIDRDIELEEGMRDFIQSNNNNQESISSLPQATYRSPRSNKSKFNLMNLSLGAIELAKNMSQILMDLSSICINSPDPEQSMGMIYYLIKKTEFLKILKQSIFLVDLDV